MNLDELHKQYPYTQSDVDKIVKQVVYENNEQAKSVEKPVAIINAGQSGSGKSKLTEISESEYSETGVVIFDVDRHRIQYPNSQALQVSHPAYFSDVTHEFASKVAIGAVDEAIKNRQNIVYDRTSNRISSIERIDRQLRQTENPYRLEMKVMATDFDTSKMRVHLRYEEQGGAGFGRYVREDVQKEIYDGVANTIKLVEERKLVDKISVYDKNLKVIYENELVNGEWQKPSQAYEILQQERGKMLTGEAALHVQQGWQKIKFKMDERGANKEGSEQVIVDTMNSSIQQLKDKHGITVHMPVQAQTLYGHVHSGTIVAVSSQNALQLTPAGKAYVHSLQNAPSLQQQLGQKVQISYNSDGKATVLGMDAGDRQKQMDKQLDKGNKDFGLGNN